MGVTVPLECYQNSGEHIRIPKSSEWLQDCFLNRITRKVNKDSTVSINKVSFNVPMQFISMKVDILFVPDDFNSAFILYEGKKYPLLKTDKNANCHTKRNNLPSVDYSKMGGSSHV